MLTQPTGKASIAADARRTVVPLPMTPQRNQALSTLIDQATAREERAARLAAHYSQQAAKHRAIRCMLEQLIP